jgi:hypothetical protein
MVQSQKLTNLKPEKLVLMSVAKQSPKHIPGEGQLGASIGDGVRLAKKG